MMIQHATPEAYQLFHEALLTLAQIEDNGIRIDLEYLDKTSKKVDRDIARLESELKDDPIWDKWRRRFGSKAKLGAHNQLGTIVFDVLKNKRGRKKKVKDSDTHEKTWKDSNDQSAFEHLDIPFVDKWFERLKLLKLRSPYISNIKEEVEEDGFLHPIFDLHTVRTYRGGGNKPNFKNYPVRNPEIAKLIRSAFIPRNNHVFVENDFSGIEVRIGACYHHDPKMIEYIKSGYDYHKEYAAKCYKLTPEQVMSDIKGRIRYCGKNQFVFPQFYGSYWKDCAANLWESCHKMNLKVGKIPLRDWLEKKGITELGDSDDSDRPEKGTFERHIQKVQEELWKLFHVYADWKEEFFEEYCRKGWFQLHTGFVCSGIYRKNEVVNYPIQGSAYHCLLWVLTQMQKWLTKYKMKSKLVGEIHDAMLGDVHVRELDDYLGYVKDLVEVKLLKRFPWIIVPMEIEAEIAPEGKSWHHKRKVKI